MAYFLGYPWPPGQNPFDPTLDPKIHGTVGKRMKQKLIDWSYQRLPDDEIQNTAKAKQAARSKGRGQAALEWMEKHVPERVNVAYNMARGPQRCLEVPGYPLAKRDVPTCSITLTPTNTGSTVAAPNQPAAAMTTIEGQGDTDPTFLPEVPDDSDGEPSSTIWTITPTGTWFSSPTNTNSTLPSNLTTSSSLTTGTAAPSGSSGFPVACNIPKGQFGSVCSEVVSCKPDETAECDMTKDPRGICTCTKTPCNGCKDFPSDLRTKCLANPEMALHCLLNG